VDTRRFSRAASICEQLFTLDAQRSWAHFSATTITSHLKWLQVRGRYTHNIRALYYYGETSKYRTLSVSEMLSNIRKCPLPIQRAQILESLYFVLKKTYPIFVSVLTKNVRWGRFSCVTLTEAVMR